MTFDHKLSPVSHFVVSFQNSSLLTKLITPSEDCFKEDASSKYTSPSSLKSWILNNFGRSMLCSSQSQDRLALMIHTPSCKCNFLNNISHFGILKRFRAPGFEPPLPTSEYLASFSEILLGNADIETIRYTNEDLDPIKRKDRTYAWYQMGLFWIAEGFNAAQLQVSSSAFSLGLNPGLCVLACFVGNVIVSLPCAASGYLGSKLGTNFPGTVRASFGMQGSKWAMVVRAVPCIIYYGIQVSLAGQAVQACTTAIWPSFANWKVNAIPASANITAQQILCFVIFWLLSLPFLYLPIKTLRFLFVAKSILVPLYWTAMFTWSVTAAGGFPDVVNVSKISS